MARPWPDDIHSMLEFAYEAPSGDTIPIKKIWNLVKEGELRKRYYLVELYDDTDQKYFILDREFEKDYKDKVEEWQKEKGEWWRAASYRRYWFKKDGDKLLDRVPKRELPNTPSRAIQSPRDQGGQRANREESPVRRRAQIPGENSNRRRPAVEAPPARPVMAMEPPSPPPPRLARPPPRRLPQRVPTIGRPPERPALAMRPPAQGAPVRQPRIDQAFQRLPRQLPEVAEPRPPEEIPIQEGYGAELNRYLEAAYEESIQEEANEPEIPLQPIRDGRMTLKRLANKLVEAHGRGLIALLSVALDIKGLPCDSWVEKRKNSSAYTFTGLKFGLLTMLTTIDEEILEHVIKGDLAKAHSSQNVTGSLGIKLWRPKCPRTVKKPCIYIQYLVDSSGEGTPPEVLRQIIQFVELYLRGIDRPEDVESHNFAWSIDSCHKKPDSWMRYSVRQGKRRYLPNNHSLAQCRLWINFVKERLRSEPAGVPLARPLAECGYASVPYDRLKQHTNHENSNFLMNLIEAICMARFDKVWGIRQYILFHTNHRSDAMFGEILLSRLSLCYIQYGGGFCHQMAGISRRGANNIDEQVPSYYLERQNAFLNSTKFQLLKQELSKMQDQIDSINQDLETEEGIEARAEEKLVAAKKELMEEMQSAKELIKEANNVTASMPDAASRRDEYLELIKPLKDLVQFTKDMKM